MNEESWSIKGIEKPVLNEWGRLYKLVHTRPPENLAIDAILVETGDATDRIHTHLKLWNQYDKKNKSLNNKPPFLIISGLVAARGWRLGEEVPKDITKYNAPWMEKWFERNGVPKEKILVDPTAKNTLEVAQRSFKIAKEKGLSTFLLSTSSYHAPRAYGTYLKVLLDIESGGLQSRLYFHPTEDLPWDRLLPDKENTRFQEIPSELNRIHEYRKKGDVATEEELRNYSNWLKSQTS